MNRLLDRIENPSDLKKIPHEQLSDLAFEIRELIVGTVSKNGGHLAPNLGTVELTIALLSVFDPPRDKIIWDVGHQAYAYKILTGRHNKFPTLRRSSGISGFLSRAESEFDAFGAGHAGTAISAALGIACARDMTGSDEHVLAVVGDASLGCGSSLEALNNVASATGRMIVVLNDNEMSISANVGAISKHLGKLLVDPRYNKWKSTVEDFARVRLRLGRLRRLYYKIEEAIKSIFLKSAVFEELGMRYVGPVDGHDIKTLIEAMRIARDSESPILLHVSTQKGKGFPPAEKNPEHWHGTTPFDRVTGERTDSSGRTYSQAFGSAITALAEKNEKVVAITAAMRSGTGLSEFAGKFKNRFFDVGISEEHAVVFAAGLATQGFLPFVAVYSSFAQRFVDYVIHDVCLQNLPVVFCMDRAGIVGDDGPTHHGIFDIPLFGCVPNITIMQPADETEMVEMMRFAASLKAPVIIRYPRGHVPSEPVPGSSEKISLGKASVISAGSEAQIWALGDMIPPALAVAGDLAADGIRTGVVNARFVKPFDQQLMRVHSGEAKLIVTMENGALKGGFGESVGDFLMDTGFKGRFLKFGWPDKFIPHGTNEDLAEKYGLSIMRIREAVVSAMRSYDSV